MGDYSRSVGDGGMIFLILEDFFGFSNFQTTQHTTTVTRQKKKQANDRSQRGLPKGVVAKSEGE